MRVLAHMTTLQGQRQTHQYDKHRRAPAEILRLAAGKNHNDVTLDAEKQGENATDLLKKILTCTPLNDLPPPLRR
jgi:hypothetical protein